MEMTFNFNLDHGPAVTAIAESLPVVPYVELLPPRLTITSNDPSGDFDPMGAKPTVSHIQPETWFDSTFLARALRGTLVHVAFKGGSWLWIEHHRDYDPYTVVINHRDGKLIYALTGYCPGLEWFKARWPD